MRKLFSKIALIITFVLILFLNVNPAFADTVVNGNFDTDLSGWSHSGYVIWESPGKVYADSSANIWQDIDLSGETLYFWYDHCGGYATFYVKIDGNLIYNVYGGTTNAEIDTSGYSGVHTVRFDANSGFHLDNVRTDYDPIPPAVGNLTTESETNGTQLYTNTTTPYFDWTYDTTQNNYMIYVGTTPGASDLWDSGNIISENTFATYDGWTLNRGVTYYVQVKAYNTEWSAWENGTFKFNQLPVITDVSATYDVYEGDYLSIDVDGADPDGDTLIFSCDRPDLFAFNTATGVATWQTGYVDAGIYNVDFGVTDSFENDNQTTVITVAEVLVAVYASGAIIEDISDDIPVPTQITANQVTLPTGIKKIFADTFNFLNKIFDLIF
ncbi:hypothetical protein KAU33_02260 [Candidatus Dependentiae bacterium]|nr:hypothetical protein [Candidatus Dependentiae bacterium]